jgi:hypothetical protein
MSMFIFGAALGSFFARLAKPRTISSRRPPALPPPRLLFALVQTRPHVVVLAISSAEDELVKEMNELNSTWNHWDLRTEGRRYEVQRVPVLVDVPPAVPAVGTFAANRR